MTKMLNECPMEGRVAKASRVATDRTADLSGALTCVGAGAAGDCSGPPILWNDHGESSCGGHQRWLARTREAKVVAA